MPPPGEAMTGGGAPPVVRVLLGSAALVAAVAVVVWWAAGARGPTDAELAEETLQRYVSAWQGGDWQTMGALAAGEGEPPDATLVEAHETAARVLRITATAVDPGPMTLDAEGGTANVPLSVTWVLEGLGEHRFDTGLRLRRVELPESPDGGGGFRFPGMGSEQHADWRVSWSHTALHPDFGPDRRFERVRMFPPRAPLLAFDGSPLVTTGEVVVVGLEPRRMTDPQQVLDSLAAHTGADLEVVAALLADPDLVPERFYPLTELERDAYDAVRDELQPVPGLVFRTQQARVAVHGVVGRQLIGATGEITAELLEELGSPYASGDIVGRSGLERVFERRLAGEPDLEARIVEPGGALVRTLAFVDGSDPQPVHTTLAPAIQAAAEAALEGAPGPAALVAVDIATGQVRAASSRPGEEFNRAIAGRYPPGSTFKIVTGLAAIAHLGLDAQSPVECPPAARFGGLDVRNAGGDGPGTITFVDAMARSCNTAFAALGTAVGAERLAAAAHGFGFDAPATLALPAGSPSFPEPADIAELAAAAIGQARVETTPAHMASVAAAAASGTWRAPTLVIGPEPREERPLPAGATGVLAGLLREVVVGGTASRAGLPDGPTGEAVHGKTGSAEFGTGDPAPTHAWFAGWRGGLAFAVLVEGGGAGGAVAAPLAAEFLRSLD